MNAVWNLHGQLLLRLRADFVNVCYVLMPTADDSEKWVITPTPPCIYGVSMMHLLFDELIHELLRGSALPGSCWKEPQHSCSHASREAWVRHQFCSRDRFPTHSMVRHDQQVFTSLRDGNRPHRIVGLTWCRPLRPKTSESTDCRKKKREEFDSHV